MAWAIDCGCSRVSLVGVGGQYFAVWNPRKTRGETASRARPPAHGPGHLFEVCNPPRGVPYQGGTALQILRLLPPTPSRPTSLHPAAFLLLLDLGKVHRDRIRSIPAKATTTQAHPRKSKALACGPNVPCPFHEERLRRVPLLSRADHRVPFRWRPAARRAVAAQGNCSSSAHRTQSRAAFTRWQYRRNDVRTSGRSERTPSMMFLAPSTPWRIPTSDSISSRARSGTETGTPSGCSGSGSKPVPAGSLESNGDRVVYQAGNPSVNQVGSRRFSSPKSQSGSRVGTLCPKPLQASAVLPPTWNPLIRAARNRRQSSCRSRSLGNWKTPLPSRVNQPDFT